MSTFISLLGMQNQEIVLHLLTSAFAFDPSSPGNKRLRDRIPVWCLRSNDRTCCNCHRNQITSDRARYQSCAFEPLIVRGANVHGQPLQLQSRSFPFWDLSLPTL